MHEDGQSGRQTHIPVEYIGVPSWSKARRIGTLPCYGTAAEVPECDGRSSAHLDFASINPPNGLRWLFQSVAASTHATSLQRVRSRLSPPRSWSARTGCMCSRAGEDSMSPVSAAAIAFIEITIRVAASNRHKPASLTGCALGPIKGDCSLLGETGTSQERERALPISRARDRQVSL